MGEESQLRFCQEGSWEVKLWPNSKSTQFITVIAKDKSKWRTVNTQHLPILKQFSYLAFIIQMTVLYLNEVCKHTGCFIIIVQGITSELYGVFYNKNYNKSLVFQTAMPHNLSKNPICNSRNIEQSPTSCILIWVVF